MKINEIASKKDFKMFMNHMLFMLFGSLTFFSILSSDNQVMDIKKPVKKPSAISAARTLMTITGT